MKKSTSFFQSFFSCLGSFVGGGTFACLSLAKAMGLKADRCSAVSVFCP